MAPEPQVTLKVEHDFESTLARVVQLPLNSEHVLVFAFRYALGRTSTASSIVTAELTRVWLTLRPSTRRQIQSEIREALVRGEAGDNCDEYLWQKLLDLPL